MNRRKLTISIESLKEYINNHLPDNFKMSGVGYDCTNNRINMYGYSNKFKTICETALPVCHEICADPDLIMCVNNGGGKDDDATLAAQERERARIHECPFRGNVECPYDETNELWVAAPLKDRS